MTTVQAPRASRTAVYLLLCIPFLLNDFGNMSITSFPAWIAFDYTVVKALPLGLIAWLVATRRLAARDFGLAGLAWPRFLLWTALLTGLGLWLDDAGWKFFESILPDTNLSHIPWDESSPLYVLDCWLGLALVALAEETVFRGIALCALRRRGWSAAGAVAASAAMFGLIHWSQGLHAIVNTALIGALFSVAMWRTGSVLPQIVAHFIINFVSFCSCVAPLGPCP